LIQYNVRRDAEALLDPRTREAWIAEHGASLRGIQVLLRWMRTQEILDHRALAVRLVRANPQGLAAYELLCVSVGNEAAAERIRTLQTLAACE
jgi:hypothetical protein